MNYGTPLNVDQPDAVTRQGSQPPADPLDTMTLVIGPAGEVAAVYDDRLQPVFKALGDQETRRAGRVEIKTELSPRWKKSRVWSWMVDLTPLGGAPVNGPFKDRGEALGFERRCVLTWLRQGLAFLRESKKQNRGWP